jgi:hypothetical protein
MKKSIISIILVASFLAPSVAGAQASTAELNQQLAALINQTIQLIERLVSQLTVELAGATNTSDQKIATTTTDQVDQKEPEAKPRISITSQNLLYRFDGSEVNDKYLANITLTAKKSSLKLTLYYYKYSSDDSQNRVQENKIFRSVDQGKTIELNGIKYSIELKDSKDRWVNINEWFDITEASATSNEEEIEVDF